MRNMKVTVVLLLLGILLVSGLACGPATYQLSTSVMQGQGIVSPSSGVFAQGDTVTLTANPASGWSFSHWGYHASGSQNPITITMDSDKTVYAYFTEIQPAIVEKPSVGYIPSGWYLDTDDPYGTWGPFPDGTMLGLIQYTDYVDYDFVMIWYGDVPPSLKGKESNANALIARAVDMAVFEPEDTGTTTISGRLAGYAEAYDPIFDYWETKIVFIEGSTYVEIYSLYDATAEGISDALGVIDSIYF